MKLDDLRDFLSNFTDDMFWIPFYDDEALVEEFDRKVLLVEESFDWPKERNKEKGNALEELMKFIFSRFENIDEIERDRNTVDNEIDIYISFNPNLMNIFFQGIKGKMLCECKNIKSSVDVGMVSKLSELCEKNNSGLGIFVSIKGLSKGTSGSLWKNAEGKRRKLYLVNKIPIISFTLDEVKLLKNEGVNFYTIIQQKVSYLVDEVDDCTISLPKLSEETEYMNYLYENIKYLEKIELITNNEKKMITDRIRNKYGIGV